MPGTARRSFPSIRNLLQAREYCAVIDAELIEHEVIRQLGFDVELR
jgi:hypothetical protein